MLPGSLSQLQLPERLGRWADGVLPGEVWGDSRYWGLLHSTLKPTSPGAPLGLLAPGSVQWPLAHFGGLLLGLEEAGPPPEGASMVTLGSGRDT